MRSSEAMTTSRGITWTRRTFTAGQWLLIIGLCFYSLMTTTPLVAAHSEWAWSGWALGAMADSAFIMAITADSTLARHGITNLGGWVRAFKWFTGLSVVYLNIWTAVEDRDAVGVAIHIIAPALVMLLAEVGPIYTAALSQAEKGATAPEGDQTGRMWVPPVPPTVVGKHAVAEAIESDISEAEHGDQPTISAEEAVSLVGSAEAVADALGMSLEAPKPRMGNSEANRIIEEGWRHGVAATVVATATGRHVQTVRRKYKELEARG